MSIRNVLRVSFLLCISVACVQNISAQESLQSYFNEEKNIIASEIRRHEKLVRPDMPTSVASTWFDVTYYRLSLTITAIPEYVRGAVLVSGVCTTDSASQLTLDLSAPMFIDSIIMNGEKTGFIRDQFSFTVSLDRTYKKNELMTLQIFYQGRPASTGFGSFEFGSHGGVPWIWSLSEPYGSKDWWPCKDNPADKADSVDILVACDSVFKVGSNGLLVSITNNGDGTRTHFWKERYPIASYLVSVSVTNFEEFSNWYHYSPTDSMEVLNYVLPENLNWAKASLSKTIDMLEIFSDMFGPYPFIKEKYGHSDIGSGGAMEHQTMTSTTTYNEGVIAHELGHQWFGDLITCRTWQHLWLNEGFAQYATALYYEHEYGTQSYWNYMGQQINNAKFANSSLFVADTSNISHLFDGAIVYSKGAVVLHMLRRVLGDSLFFRAIYEYASSTDLRYSSALTEDFQNICETVSGRSLQYFFSEWVYGEKYPRYDWYWSASDSAGLSLITLSIDQSTGTSNPLFFTMPVDIRIHHDGSDTLITVFNDAQYQFFSFVFPFQPDSITLDPDNWILKEAFQLTDVADDRRTLPGKYVMEQNYPNPFNATTIIRYALPAESRVTLSIINMLGQNIALLTDAIQSSGDKSIPWDASSVPSGMYLYRLNATSCSNPTHSVSVIKKMVLVK